MHSLHNPAIPLLGRFKSELKTRSYKYLYTDTYNHFIHNQPELNPKAHLLRKVYTLWSQWNKKKNATTLMNCKCTMLIEVN